MGKSLIRMLALLAPLFTVFWPLIYEHPDPEERKVIQACLVTGIMIYLITGIIIYLT